VSDFSLEDEMEEISSDDDIDSEMPPAATPMDQQHDDTHIGSNVEISADCTSTTERLEGQIEEDRLDEAASKHWKLMNEKAGRQKFVETPDACSIRSDIRAAPNEELKSRVCSSMGITPEKYDKLAAQYS